MLVAWCLLYDYIFNVFHIFLQGTYFNIVTVTSLDNHLNQSQYN